MDLWGQDGVPPCGASVARAWPTLGPTNRAEGEPRQDPGGTASPVPPTTNPSSSWRVQDVGIRRREGSEPSRMRRAPVMNAR